MADTTNTTNTAAAAAKGYLNGAVGSVKKFFSGEDATKEELRSGMVMLGAAGYLYGMYRAYNKSIRGESFTKVGSVILA